MVYVHGNDSVSTFAASEPGFQQITLRTDNLLLEPHGKGEVLLEVDGHQLIFASDVGRSFEKRAMSLG